MYFYRIMQPEELKTKKINENKGNFEWAINTHNYLAGVNYIHLFLNAESCFEDFTLESFDKLIVVKFDIPDDIVFKYGIGLGGYNLFLNKCTLKYRELVTKNSVGTSNFWLPEIAIPASEFNYNWCVRACKPEYVLYHYELPQDFMTDDLYYKEIMDDGYLKGYQSRKELLYKYKKILKLKKRIIKSLQEAKTININPKDLNNDSLFACLTLINYALKHRFIEQQDEIKITLNNEIQDNSINITSDFIGTEKDKNIIINKQTNHTVPGFTAMLDKLGFDIDRTKLHLIANSDNVKEDNILVKK